MTWTVLSLPQPFAFAAIAYAMDVVPLYYRTRIRGPVLIHAPRLSVPRDAHAPAEFIGQWQAIVTGWMDRWQCDPPCTSSYKRMADLSGGILGAAIIEDCVSEHTSTWWKRDDWKWGLVLGGSRPLPFTPCPGIAGLWELPAHIEVPL